MVKRVLSRQRRNRGRGPSPPGAGVSPEAGPLPGTAQARGAPEPPLRRDAPHWSVFAAIALLAASTLLFEIALVRIFSYAIWHHFAFMVVSIALLGFAVSGVALHLYPGLGAPPARRAAWYALGYGVTAVLAITLVARLPFDPTRLADEPRQIVYLLGYYLGLLIPFALAGLAIVTLLNGYASAVGRLYMSDLAGAGWGCLAIAPLIQLVGAEGVILTVAAVAAGSACLLQWGGGQGRERRRLFPWLGVVLILVALVPLAGRVLSLPPGRGKGLTDWLDRRAYPLARLAYTKWSALSRIDVVEHSGEVMWTRNPDVEVPLPPQTQIVIDGDAATPIVDFSGDLSELAFLDYTLSSSALQAFHPARVLVIGAGGGVDVLTALRHGAAHVDAVELNPIIVDLVSGRYADRSGRWSARPDVTVHIDEGRSFVRRHEGRFDAIQLSLIDTWAASASGAYSLAEGYLYTVEAFEDYLKHLADDGMLTITRWLWYPPRETLKLCTVADAALRRLGVERPGEHVVVLALGSIGNVIVKRTPFTEADLLRLRQVAEARRFKFIYAPSGPGDNPFTSFFRTPDPAAFVASYVYDISPATDDSPFFFQFGRWRDANPWGKGWREHMVVLSGRLVLLTVLAQALVLSLLLLVLPLLVRGGRARQRASAPAGTAAPAAGGAVAYFFLIGLSFMLLEIALMQRFTLFLGHPVYAITFVLAILLLAAGAGSMISEKMGLGQRRPWLVFLGVAGLSLAYAAFLPALFRATLGLKLSSRLALGALCLLPLGFLLGAPFPAGIAALTRRGGSSLIGWAWAANGCASVLGPILAVLIAIDFNFATVMAAAAAGYGAAYLAFRGWLWAAPGS